MAPQVVHLLSPELASPLTEMCAVPNSSPKWLAVAGEGLAKVPPQIGVLALSNGPCAAQSPVSGLGSSEFGKWATCGAMVRISYALI